MIGAREVVEKDEDIVSRTRPFQTGWILDSGVATVWLTGWGRSWDQATRAEIGGRLCIFNLLPTTALFSAVCSATSAFLISLTSHAKFSPSMCATALQGQANQTLHCSTMVWGPR